MRIDCFPFLDELTMLRCRLETLAEVPDLVHVLVEADTVQGSNEPKPYVFAEHRDDFADFADRIVYVQATGLPDDPDPWVREHAQREWATVGLRQLDPAPDDVVMLSDVDEIPTPVAAEFCQPQGITVFEQRMHPFAVDWQHPDPWRGTVATRYSKVESVAMLRDARLLSPEVLPAAGWHFSWVSNTSEQRERKLKAFCHTELISTWEGRLDDCYETGLHVDGKPLEAVEVDDTWPAWIAERRCPDAWFRPRTNRERPQIVPPMIIKRPPLTRAEIPQVPA